MPADDDDGHKAVNARRGRSAVKRRLYNSLPAEDQKKQKKTVYVEKDTII